MTKRILLIVGFLFATYVLHAQFVSYGTDPARLKWNIAQTPHYRLLYPRGIDSAAYRYAVFLENAYPYIARTMSTSRYFTFPVVLHPLNMRSNGLVAWAPRQVELITTPPPYLYAQSWDRQLVLHESRHVVQTSKLMQGVFNPLRYIIGEQAAGIAAFGVPRWFFEGDAVVAETALSHSGRGRLPEFNMAYRAQMLSGKFFSFDKWYLGSYKDYTGDFYALGYDMTAYARMHYGADVWDNVLDRYARRIYALPPFGNALGHYTGIRVKDLFAQTFDYLHNEWQAADSIMHTPVQYLSEASKGYTSYLYPQAVTDSTIVAVKRNMSDIPALVLLRSNGSEEWLAYIGGINSRLTTVVNNRVYWTEYVNGIRWSHENYSVIKYYDFTAKHVVTLTPYRSCYLAPSIDSSGRIIAASQYSAVGSNKVALIDAINGNQQVTFNVPASAFIKETAFSTTGDIISLAVNDDGISILQLNPRDGGWYGLMQPTYANINALALHNGKVFFESGLNGTNNIYCIDTITLQRHRITQARFGMFSPAFSKDGTQMFFSDYQAGGYRIGSVAVDSVEETDADFDKPYRFSLAATVSGQEQFNMDTARLQSVAFNAKPYRRGLHTFKIHSWAPFYYDINDAITANADDFTTLIKPGATVFSQNTLNTAVMQAGWYYDNGYNYGKLSFTYMGWFPVIDVDVTYGGKAFDVVWTSANNGQAVPKAYYADHYLADASARVYVPLNFTRNHYIHGLQPSVAYSFTNNRYQQIGDGSFRYFQYTLSELRYYYYRSLAVRDILPRWGYQVRVQSLNTPFDAESFGSLYAARLTTYLPGLRENDGLMLRVGYQYQTIDKNTFYILEELIDAPRGYNYLYRTRQQWLLRGDYAFAIMYPDFSVFSWAYIKRVRANLFADLSYNQASKNGGWASQNSYGIDLIADGNVLRLNYPLSAGIRLIKPAQLSGVKVEGIFAINFQ